MTLLYTKLPNRAAIIISGPDRFTFLKGLITNSFDMNSALTYACLLTPQGKFLYDFFLRNESESIILDCEGGERGEALFKKLRLYKLHSNIKLNYKDNADVYALWGGEADYNLDPRHIDLGYRCYAQPQAEETDFATWDKHRITLGIPDGSRDMIEGKTTLAEAHIDQLNGIDYKKGCYVGQELTARMHYRGLAKKHLYVVRGDLPDSGTDIEHNGKPIAEMRSQCDGIGLALIKDAIAHDWPHPTIAISRPFAAAT